MQVICFNYQVVEWTLKEKRCKHKQKEFGDFVKLGLGADKGVAMLV